MKPSKTKAETVATQGFQPERCFLFRCYTKAYYRFQPSLEADLPAFRAGADNLNRMIEAGERYLKQPHIEEKLNQLAALLLSRQSTPPVVPAASMVGVA